MSRFRLLFAICALLAMAALLVACGGDDDGGGAGNEDPQKVLDQTFSGDRDIDSGNLDLSFKVEASGDQGGNLDAQLSGPFEDRGKGEVPGFDLTASAAITGSGDDDFSFDGGLLSTGDAAFVNYKGNDYEVDRSIFDQFRESIEQSAGQQQDQGSVEQLFDQLGIEDPKSLLINLQNEGTEDVEGTETIHISGDLDVRRLVDGLKNLLGGAGALGALGGGTDVPSPEELDQVADAIKEAHFDVYSGAEDKILRRLAVALTIEPPGGATNRIEVALDFSIGDVNEPQTIEAPSGARPFSDLLRELGVPPGALNQLGGGLGGLGGGAGGDTGGPTAPALPGAGGNAEQAQEYLNCIAKAQSAADLQRCQSLAP